MSFIDTIEIKNFKSIRHQKIEGCKRINVFIGYPNVGKSNIVEALSLLSIKKDGFDISSLIRMDKLNSIFFNASIERSIEIIVNNSISFSGRYLREAIQFTFESDVLLGGSTKLFRKFEIFDNRTSDFFQNSVSKNHKLAEVKKYEFERSIKYNEGSLSILNDPWGENLFELMYSNETLKKEVSELFKFYDLKLAFDTNSRTFKILKNVNDDIVLISYSMIADTLRRLIFYKAAISSNNQTAMLFEEPEAHMFPPYIRKFTSDVIFDESNQFFITTHSPYVLDEFNAEASNDLALFIVDYKDGETIIHRLSEEEMLDISTHGVDLFYNIESYLKHGQVNND